MNCKLKNWILIFLFLGLSGGWLTAQQKISFVKLNPKIYVYTTFKDLNGTVFPSNSMYLEVEEGIVMLDTPWDNTQFQPLLDTIWKRHQKKVIACIVTHFHDDRTAGVQFLKERKIPVYSSAKTDELALKYGENRADHLFYQDTVFSFGNLRIETYYPGEGHTPDNIILQINSAYLYGGCFLKSLENHSIGNLEHANVKAWKKSVKNALRKFPKNQCYIPGHFAWSAGNALTHTKKLVKQHLKANS